MDVDRGLFGGVGVVGAPRGFGDERAVHHERAMGRMFVPGGLQVFRWACATKQGQECRMKMQPRMGPGGSLLHLNFYVFISNRSKKDLAHQSCATCLTFLSACEHFWTLGICVDTHIRHTDIHTSLRMMSCHVSPQKFLACFHRTDELSILKIA